MRSSGGWLWLGLGILPMFASCEQAQFMPDRCNIRLAVVSPDPATLMVGQEVTLDAQLTASQDCLPADAEPGSLRWASKDSGIATADAVSGRVRAINAGTTEISLTTATTHTLLATSTIQVVP
jgi:Big-like domain-containing protein